MNRKEIEEEIDFLIVEIELMEDLIKEKEIKISELKKELSDKE